MAKTGDVQFTTTAPLDYNYMLVTSGNEKEWYVEQRVLQPPSLILTKIDMVILAAPKMTQADETVIATRTIATVLTELRTLAEQETLIVLDGFDGQTYNVMLDPKATKTKAVKDESGRITHYHIAISCWDMKPAA